MFSVESGCKEDLVKVSFTKLKYLLAVLFQSNFSHLWTSKSKSMRLKNCAEIVRQNVYAPEAYLESSRTSTMELLCEKS